VGVREVAEELRPRGGEGYMNMKRERRHEINTINNMPYLNDNATACLEGRRRKWLFCRKKPGIMK
jgi:hypothetical protein